MMSEWINASTSPSASMSSTDLSCGSRVILRPGGGWKSTSSSSSATHSTDLCGTPYKSVEWVAELDEDVDFQPPPGLKITRLPHDKSVEDMLAEGEVDALIHSDIIKPIEAGDPRVGRLWPDYKAEEIRFYQKTEIFPIMHVMGIRQDIIDRYPWVPINLFQ